METDKTQTPLPVGCDALFGLGDRVAFVLVRDTGRQIHMKRQEGKIVDFSKPKGTKALVKYHAGNYIWIRCSKLTMVKPNKEAEAQASLGESVGSSGRSAS